MSSYIVLNLGIVRGTFRPIPLSYLKALKTVKFGDEEFVESVYCLPCKHEVQFHSWHLLKKKKTGMVVYACNLSTENIEMNDPLNSLNS